MLELIAPVGSHASLSSALSAKADAIYFGIDQLNMRLKSASNFSLNELEYIVKRCHLNGTKAYLTLNSIIYDEEIPLIKKICKEAKRSNIDAIIAHDMAVIQIAQKEGLTIHISTQANISNIESVRYYAQFAKAIVLARELTLENIVQIAHSIKEEGLDLKLEIFIHGAMCVAISGKCYMSLAQYNASANRGECLQACRRKYLVKEEGSEKELLLDNNFVMSPKDLCTITFLDQIVKSGVSLLKIEGRARSAEYVKTTTTVYKEALESIATNSYTSEKIEKWQEELKKVFNRGFWSGYYLGKETDAWTKHPGSIATHKKVLIGKITNFFPKISVAECLIEGISLPQTFDALIIGDTTGSLDLTLSNIKYHSEKLITFKIPEKVRKNDSLFMLVKN